MTNYLSILGFGGHSKVVIDIAQNLGVNISGFYDDNPNTYSQMYNGIKVLGPINSIVSGNAVIAIGNNKIRKNIVDQTLPINWKKLIHPSAIIAKDVEIGEGTVVMAGAIIQPGVIIGRHCIINTAASIDHDCIIQDYVHIAPGVAISGGVEVCEGTLIGVGTSIVPYVTIGKWATIGAGSAVISDLPDYSTAVGVPAMIKKINDETI
jgi:sugar O-acyltransferase (sialic acid O-acetyltransferase NeuD family)